MMFGRSSPVLPMSKKIADTKSPSVFMRGLLI
jgi:hypothetical protein